jgi:hypothetical protein
MAFEWYVCFFVALEDDNYAKVYEVMRGLHLQSCMQISSWRNYKGATSSPGPHTIPFGHCGFFQDLKSHLT